MAETFSKLRMPSEMGINIEGEDPCTMCYISPHFFSSLSPFRLVPFTSLFPCYSSTLCVLSSLSPFGLVPALLFPCCSSTFCIMYTMLPPRGYMDYWYINPRDSSCIPHSWATQSTVYLTSDLSLTPCQRGSSLMLPNPVAMLVRRKSHLLEPKSQALSVGMNQVPSIVCGNDTQRTSVRTNNWPSG